MYETPYIIVKTEKVIFASTENMYIKLYSSMHDRSES